MTKTLRQFIDKFPEVLDLEIDYIDDKENGFQLEFYDNEKMFDKLFNSEDTFISELFDLKQ